MNSMRPARSIRHVKKPQVLHSCVLAALLLLAAGCAGRAPQFQLTSIKGHMPDLAFKLTDDSGQAINASAFHGKIALLYFGYTHCPDACPLTLAHLHAVMQQLGQGASDIRILFVSVDPSRDTPQVLHKYVKAFDPRIVGLTGTMKQISALARRYRVAFSRGPTRPDGSYDVTHGSAIYFFDREGHARLIATPVDSVDSITHDLRLMLAQS